MTHGVFYTYYLYSPDRWRLIANVEIDRHIQLDATRNAFDNISLLDFQQLELPEEWWDIGAGYGFPEIHPDEYQDAPETILDTD